MTTFGEKNQQFKTDRRLRRKLKKGPKSKYTARSNYETSRDTHSQRRAMK